MKLRPDEIASILRDQIADYEIAVKRDGTLLGIKSRAIADLGERALRQQHAPHIGMLDQPDLR